MNLHRAIRTAAAFAVVVVATIAPAAFAADFTGKTIKLIIGQSPGGGTDTLARTWSPFLSKHLPGHPTIVIEAQTGAGGMQAVNYVYEKARPDGLTLAWGGFNPVGMATDAPGLRADFTKFEFIGAGSSGGRVQITRTGVTPPIKTSTDIMKVQGLKQAGFRPTESLDIVGRLGFDVMGVKYRYVPGYRGAAKILPAMLQGEIDGMTTGITSLRTAFEPQMIDQGKAIMLWYFPFFDINGKPVKNTDFRDDEPAIQDVYKKVYGKDPSGPYWEALKWMQTVSGKTSMTLVAPPKTPKDIVDTLRKAYEDAKADPELEPALVKSTGSNMVYVTIPEGLKIMEMAQNPDPKIAKFLKDYIAAAEQ
jgi:tripartite-type tricarboxylate transporter receptor subunit TctC